MQALKNCKSAIMILFSMQIWQNYSGEKDPDSDPRFGAAVFIHKEWIPHLIFFSHYTKWSQNILGTNAAICAGDDIWVCTVVIRQMLDEYAATPFYVNLYQTKRRDCMCISVMKTTKNDRQHFCKIFLWHVLWVFVLFVCSTSLVLTWRRQCLYS